MMAVLLLISIAISFIFYGMYVKKARELQDIKKIYEALHRGGGLDNVIKVLSEEISDMGVIVIAFFTRPYVIYIQISILFVYSKLRCSIKKRELIRRLDTEGRLKLRAKISRR